MKGRGLENTQEQFQKSSDIVAQVPIIGPIMDAFLKPIASWLKMGEKPPPPPPPVPETLIQHGI